MNLRWEVETPGRDPSEEELRAFVESMLSNVDRQLREPAVIDEAIRDAHALWVLLYRVASDENEA